MLPDWAVPLLAEEVCPTIGGGGSAGPLGIGRVPELEPRATRPRVSQRGEISVMVCRKYSSKDGQDRAYSAEEREEGTSQCIQSTAGCGSRAAALYIRPSKIFALDFKVRVSRTCRNLI